MQLGYTILYVPDVPATLKFYEAAFGLTTRFLHEGGDYGELETGSTALAFSAHSLMQQLGKNPQAASPTAPCFEIALCTPDVAAALDAMGPDDCLCGRHQRLFGGVVHAHGLSTAQVRHAFCYVFSSFSSTFHGR